MYFFKLFGFFLYVAIGLYWNSSITTDVWALNKYILAYLTNYNVSQGIKMISESNVLKE